MADLKPIETRYKGYRFRSRLEARWAVFFDALGIEWEYEKEGYDLGEVGWYLPDFWLHPGQNHVVVVEIKPASPTTNELARCRALRDVLAVPVILFPGEPPVLREKHWPGEDEYRGLLFEPHCEERPDPEDGVGVTFCHCRRCDGFGYATEDYAQMVYCKPECNRGDKWACTLTTEAALRARSARFEHVECG
jgi:hypothetical protein